MSKAKELYRGMFTKKATSIIRATSQEKIIFNLAYIKGMADYALSINSIDKFMYDETILFIDNTTEEMINKEKKKAAEVDRSCSNITCGLLKNDGTCVMYPESLADCKIRIHNGV